MVLFVVLNFKSNVSFNSNIYKNHQFTLSSLLERTLNNSEYHFIKSNITIKVNYSIKLLML